MDLSRGTWKRKKKGRKKEEKGRKIQTTAGDGKPLCGSFYWICALVMGLGGRGRGREEKGRKREELDPGLQVMVKLFVEAFIGFALW